MNFPARIIARVVIVAAILGLGFASTAQADRSFSVRYTTNDTGSIKGIANTNMTCPSSASGCSTAQTQDPTSSANSYYNNNYDMTYVDVDSDSSTFNSSTANQSLPSGSTILFAGLYWGGDYSTGSASAPNSSDRNKVKLKLPGSSTYTTITASTLDDSTLNVGRYQAFADVTSLIQALPNAGNGTYGVANIQAGKGSDHYAGWTLIVAYRNTAETAKNMSIFDGLVTIRPSDPPTTIPFSGFLTPPSGPVNPQIGFVTWEGDHGLVGDSASLNGNTLSDAQHPATNFFDSRISYNGVLYTDRNPNYANALGIDAAWTTPPPGTVGNSETSATLRVTTSGDQYLPGVITFQTEIYAPKIDQTKSVTDDNGGNVRQGDTLTYKIYAKNNGQDGTSNFVLRDPIPPNTTYVPGSINITKNTNASTGAKTDASSDDIAEYDSANSRIVARLGEGATTSVGGNVKPDSEYEVTFKVKVNGPTVNPVPQGTVLTNTATASFNSRATGTPLTATSTATATVTATPNLKITKVRTGAAFTAGGNSAYTLTVNNHGDAPTSGTVSVTDPIPSGLTVTAISAPGWTCNSVPASSLSCSRSDALAAGASYPNIVLTVAIDSGVSGEVENTSTVSGGGDSDLSDNTSSSTNPVSNVADLGLTKTASKDEVLIGENFTYALTVRNYGPSKATSVAITDELPAGLSFVSATPAPGCAIQPVTGTLGCEVGTLNSGASYTVTVTVHVDGSAHGVLHNTATVGAQQTDPNPGNNSGSDDVEVLGADLQVTKVKKSPATVVTGNTVVYEIKVKNLGPSNATGVVLTDALPAGLSGVTTNQGACTVAAPNVSCVVGNLASGSTWTVEVSGTVAVGTTELTNNASATGNEFDPNLSNNHDDVTTPVGKSADLSIVKNADPAQVVAGGNILYTFVVSNAGPDEATGITITDTLPAGVTYVDGAPGCSAAGQVVTCTLNPIAAGGSRQTGITVSVSPSATGVITNAAHVTGNENDPDPSNNDDSVDTPVKANADVEITKTASPANPVSGDTVTYTLKAKNNGPDPAANVVVTDVLPAGVSFVSADSPCTEASGTVTCALGTLAAGEEVTLEVKVTVDHWGDTDPSADHLLDVQKVENQIDLNPGEQKTIQVTCPSGYFATDGSVRIDEIDQGTGDWTAPQVLENRASSLDTWQGTVRNTAAGRAQAKIFAVCVRKTTGDENGHHHNLLVSAPVTVTDSLVPGNNTKVLQCGPGQVAIQPGFIADKAGHLVYSQPEGNGWKFIYKVEEGGTASFSIRCMDRQVDVVNGHTHDLKLQRISTEVEVAPGTVNEAQLTCPDGSKGIVAGWDLDDGLVSLGNDPRPVTRAFKLYNPTDHTLSARLSLLCLGLRTGGERVPSKTIINTANISTSSTESETGNNGSSAGINVNGIDNTPIDNDPDPDKPHPNNPIAKTIVGKGVSYSASGVSFSLKCSGTCGGFAKLTTLRKLKVKGKKYGRGTVLARRQYFIGKAGTKKVKLTLTGKGRKILKSGKAHRALLSISGGTRKVVKVGH
ncbi:MAG TPA: isopeptide-forming domain-containing fimbrial protein [Solirubrobacterales bacterium]|nr:DUF11 domain-containing protein [Solirubrobacterales bacterium]HMU27219.1 isopeptide-forming domain-containing fimbrial protein [Solirubrobacterales bacterium]HMX71082.1 isopeptide-forming domain-containing fimbrial protein [Solirubrobacterales bacterium]HNA24002.1 isopeptide-forming domain-containing fimbrial protein [Solirubrobacterales bacterium]HNA44273.1 isopeptide-forming domain-containing fimbrial protein [Solirubrobacterales bacterium]